MSHKCNFSSLGNLNSDELMRNAYVECIASPTAVTAARHFIDLSIVGTHVLARYWRSLVHRRPRSRDPSSHFCGLRRSDRLPYTRTRRRHAEPRQHDVVRNRPLPVNNRWSSNRRMGRRTPNLSMLRRCSCAHPLAIMAWTARARPCGGKGPDQTPAAISMAHCGAAGCHVLGYTDAELR